MEVKLQLSFDIIMLTISGSSLSFEVDDKPAFIVPLKDVSQATTGGQEKKSKLQLAFKCTIFGKGEQQEWQSLFISFLFFGNYKLYSFGICPIINNIYCIKVLLSSEEPHNKALLSFM